MPQVVCNIVEVYVYRLVAGEAQFLLLRRSAESRLGGTWQSVHGHLEENETAWDAARRELAEETGLNAQTWHQLESVNTFFIAATDRIHLCPGFAARVAADAEPVLNHENDAYHWLPIEEALPRFHWPGQRQAVREVCDLILAGSPAAQSLRLTPT